MERNKLNSFLRYPVQTFQKPSQGFSWCSSNLQARKCFVEVMENRWENSAESRGPDLQDASQLVSPAASHMTSGAQIKRDRKLKTRSDDVRRKRLHVARDGCRLNDRERSIETDWVSTDLVLVLVLAPSALATSMSFIQHCRI